MSGCGLIHCDAISAPIVFNFVGPDMTKARFVDRQSRRNFRLGTALVFSLAIGVLAACETPSQRVARHEDHLAAAGFIVRPANTPERQAMLRRMPANHFVRRTRGDDTHYVYADPLVCGCLYVGTQQAYDLYKRDQEQRRLADEQQMTADTYSDAAWNWNTWGPWNPGFGFGYGPGFGW